MKKKDAEFIWKKLEEWTRCDIMARYGRFDNLEYADYAMKKIDIEDEIREFLFGTGNTLELAYKWKLLKRHTKKIKKKKLLRKRSSNR